MLLYSRHRHATTAGQRELLDEGASPFRDEPAEALLAELEPSLCAIDAMTAAVRGYDRRVEELARRAGVPIADFFESYPVTDLDTSRAIADLQSLGYLADPHSALAWRALANALGPGPQPGRTW